MQRRVTVWRAQEGPSKDVSFEQAYALGDRAQSDFTCMNHLGVKIQGVSFPHLSYHFALAYSSWESGMICESESFEEFSAGLQKAPSQLGVVPRLHQTDWYSRTLPDQVKSLHGAMFFVNLHQKIYFGLWRSDLATSTVNQSGIRVLRDVPEGCNA